MKKNVVFYLLIILGLCFAACGKKQGNETSDSLVTSGEGEDVSAVATKGTMPTNEPTSTAVEELPMGVQKKAINDVIQGDEWNLGNSQGNLLALGYICESSGILYYRDYNQSNFLCTVNLNEGEKFVLARDIPRAIQVMEDFVYYIDDDKESANYNCIKRIKREDGKIEIIGREQVGSMIVTKDCIYYTGRDYIAKMNIDGTNIEKIVEKKGAGDYGWFCIYGDSIITGGVLYGTKLLGVNLDNGDENLLYQGYMFPQIEEDMLYCSNEKGKITAVSISTGESKTWQNAYGNRSVCSKGLLYYTNGSQLCLIDTKTDEVRVLYPIEKNVESSSIELYGLANNCLFFTEREKREDARPLFKYINLKTMEISVVP